MQKIALLLRLICSISVLLLWQLCAAQQWEIVSKNLLFSNPPFSECHASSIVEVSPSKKLVTYFAGSSEGQRDVAIWMTAVKNGITAAPVKVADGKINDTLRYPCWNPVLFKTHLGQLLLFYKVGPSPRDWWGMVATSPDNGKTWSQGKRLPPGILGAIKNKPVQLQDGTILSPSSTETHDQWKVHMERSTDEGKTWKLITVDHASDYQVIQPSLITHANGTIQMLCRSKHNRIIQAFSTDQGKSWSTLSETNLLNPNSGVDAVTLANGWHLLVYNPTTSGKDWWNGRGKLRVAASKDGNDWKDVAVLEEGDKEEYSYPAIIQTTDGQVHITYTYNRKNIRYVVLKQVE